MKASLIDFDHTGRTLKRRVLHVGFCTRERTPVIEIALTHGSRIERSILVPIKLLRKRLAEECRKAGI